MKLTPEASAILRVISEHLKNNKVTVKNLKSFLTYKGVHDRLKLKQAGETWGRSLDNQGLGDLAEWAKAKGLPAVTGLVIDKTEQQPKGKFFSINQKDELADQGWWLEQAAESIKHNWDQYLVEASEAGPIYFPWKNEGYEDEIPMEETLLEHLKKNQPVSLKTRSIKDHKNFTDYLAIVTKVEERVFFVDYGDDLVWKENKAKHCIRGAYLLDYNKSPSGLPEWYPFDVSADETGEAELREGKEYTAVVNKWERNSHARLLCIRKYGWKCQVCKLDFEKRYGDIGKGFIHVHHLKKLSDIRADYRVDPEKDLIPVCPNCHSMIHKFDDVGLETVAHLRKILQES